MTDLSQNRLAQRCVYGGCSDAYSGFHIIYIYIYIFHHSIASIRSLFAFAYIISYSLSSGASLTPLL
jgi:hypothetical protein